MKLFKSLAVSLLTLEVVIFALCVIVPGSAFLIYLRYKNGNGGKSADVWVSEQNTQPKEAEEITKIKATEDLLEQQELYVKLIERVGPLEAQDLLYKSGLPFTGQTHLLNHTVGDFLFAVFGVEGVAYCRDHFLSSCYHGAVLHVVEENGINGVVEIMKACERKNADVGQCAHAVGHGLLVWRGYARLTDALTYCDSAGKKISNFPLFNCYDGVFMENIWGVHDGVPSPDRWIKPNDLTYPCNDKRIASKYLKACWGNQPVIAFQALGGDFEKTADVCLRVSNTFLQKACFDGLARQIHPYTRGSVDETFRLCGKMPEAWVEPCLATVAYSYSSVGDPKTAAEICERIDNPSMCSPEAFGNR